MIRFLRKIMPSFVVGAYHYTLAFLAHWFYGRPSKKLYVIGVTGTKGKTTTANLFADILNAAGHKTGVTSSVLFRFGDERRINDTKQGMPGRFCLQKLLAEMVKKGCTHAVIETTSEGMLQYRHRFIDYRAAIFTNLSPEHIERHGGFEKYRDTKIGLFEKLARKKDGIGVYNLDDENVEWFLKPKVATKIGFSLKNNFQSIFKIVNVQLKNDGSEFDVSDVHFEIPLIGEFNVYNTVGAIAMARALGVSLEKCAEVLKKPTRISGRFEVIHTRSFTNVQDDNDDFVVIVDYAHEPKSLEEAYRAAKLFLRRAQNERGKVRGTDAEGKLICLLGSQGGGRDKWKRTEMGKIAAKYCDEIILTNEDPYDEIPLNIMNDIEQGISQTSNPIRQSADQSSNVYKIIDRKEAIKKAISLAVSGDVVILTGKGGEVWMCLEKGKKIPWDEKEIVEESLRELGITS